MAETLTLNKQTKPSAPPPAAAADPAKAAVPTLRETRPKTFPTSTLKPLGYGETEIMTVTVPAEWTFEDVMKPIAWSNVVGPIAANQTKTTIDRIGSLIYLNGPRFIAWLHIDEIERDELKNPCGVKLTCVGPAVDLKTGEPMPMDRKTRRAWIDPTKPQTDKAA